MKKFKGDFMECDTCRAKPGSPELCRGCYLNCILIDRLLRGEGELLEGGTVEKWCCGINEICNCKCHNKKEEKVFPISQEKWQEQNKFFNRETPKLPEEFHIEIYDATNTERDRTISLIGKKLNEVIRYLKAKE